jgi:hypothetical protein
MTRMLKIHYLRAQLKGWFVDTAYQSSTAKNEK